MRRWLALLALGAGVLGAAALARGRPRWPETGAALRELPPAPAPGSPRHRIALDPGHGAPENSGNRSAFCVDEQDFTLGLAEDVRARLDASGRFQVSLTRRRGELVEYAARIERARAFGAELLVSLHSDVRGRASEWEPRPGLRCLQSRAEPGFAVIFSDAGDPGLATRRRTLAETLGERLSATGLLPYSGRGYAGDYAGLAHAPGVFVDRHAPGARIFVLHAPKLPSVLIETHNALDDREALRWDQPETRAAFASALASALSSVLAGSAPAQLGT